MPNSATHQQAETSRSFVELNGEFSLQDFASVATLKANVALPRPVLDRVATAHERLGSLMAQERHVYGINTGFGSLAGRVVEAKELPDLQKNLVYHLATGTGAPLSWLHGRALLLARLVVLSKGYSGCSPELLVQMAEILNAGLAPIVPEKGTVGASGDLTPSSHMALALMGEGGFIDQNGETYPGKRALDGNGIQPLKLKDREGLALVNGTSAMTGIAAANASLVETAVTFALRSAAVYADIMGVRTEAWSPHLSAVRPHPGQIDAQSRLAELVADSARVQPEMIASQRVEPGIGVEGEAVWPQDPYSLRCLPQAFGAVLDMVAFHNDVVVRELNAVTDNPILVEGEPFAIHGGNFYGQHVGFVSDSLVMAMIKVAIVMERQIARLTDENFNKGLPPYLQPGTIGLNSGFMGAQVTASALLGEMRTQALPASVQSVPTNGNNQDINTMGTVAARKAATVLADLTHILAIHALCVAQAYELSAEQEDCLPFATASAAFVIRVRKFSPSLKDDRPLSADIQTVAAAIQQGQF